MVDLKYQVPVEAPPAKAYAAVATQKGMQGWWTADTKMDEKAGGKVEFGFDKRGMVFRMKVEKLVPGKMVVMTCHGDHPEWDGTTLTWTIARDGDTSVLQFTHGGWKSTTEFCAGCNAMWGNLMFRLKDLVEGNSRGPQWTT
jgi:uncharacterized protein YndB with AHSA1/START domain